MLRIISLILAAAALVLTFRAKWVREKLLKRSDPDEGMVLRVKFAALAVCVVSFVLAMLYR